MVALQGANTEGYRDDQNECIPHIPPDIQISIVQMIKSMTQHTIRKWIK